jgi:hypothetical protein
MRGKKSKVNGKPKKTSGSPMLSYEIHRSIERNIGQLLIRGERIIARARLEQEAQKKAMEGK